MPKAFEYRDAKILINYYKKLLKDLRKSAVIKQNIFNELNQQIRNLQNNKYFYSLVENGIAGKDLDFNDDDLNMFLTNVYYSMKISLYSEKCNHLYNLYSSSIEEYISSLSSGSNALFWLFSSKKKKTNAEEAYEKLFSLKNEDFVLSSTEVLKHIDDLKDVDFNTIKKDFLAFKSKYNSWIKIFEENNIVDDELVPIFKDYSNEYKLIQNNLSAAIKSIDDSVNQIKESVDRLLAEELVISLRSIPVEELARDKSGIKIKYLKDAGYDNLADVYGATAMQIASIYGISKDKAYTIKSKCDTYAKRIYKESKIKLSIDNKSKFATNVVQSIYVYIKKIEYSKMIDKLNLEYGNNLKNAVKELDNIGNGIKWIFLNQSEVISVRNSYDYVKENLYSHYKIEAENICKKFKCRKSNQDNVWNDFAENSIKYFNVIEEVYPGVLGTDDAIYGLPEELARQIQNECFFPDGLLCTLRKYQEWGVKYALHQEKVLLGDEMGLGKTIQAIATMVSLKNIGATHFMVVCPASVVTNWCREIIKHSKLRPTKIHGGGKDIALKSWLKTGGVAVTNFESLPHIKLENNYKFNLLIVDEAHYIKNTLARRSINTKNLTLHTDRLLFMTGTALENNVDEMISLIEVLRPSIAESIKNYAFMSAAPQFREKIAPVYYRRKREDVLTELPDKIESKEWCSLNPDEEAIYEEVVLNKEYQKARRVSWNIDDLNKSCKAQRLKEIVEEAEAEGRKVLVFSFFLDTIAKIYDFLKGKCLNPINGSVNVNRRQEIIDEFDNAPAGTVLLAQINSGGTGLNIQSASVVVICEPQFKPSIENQAISRAYRMGQARNVLVYRLLCEDTIDERLTEVLEEKQKLFDAFADKSIAGQESLEIDDKTFGSIIKEEIDRINKKHGIDSETNQDFKNNNDNLKVNNNQLLKCDYDYEIEKGKTYYQKLMKMSYNELVKYLINKYGSAKCDYFTNSTCKIKNKKVTRTNEGLFCHHIDEDKAIMLSNDKFAIENPFTYQKADRLVYCNFLEHFLLHILIAEEPKNKNANRNEIQGIGGAINFICRQLNDLYNGYQYTKQWLINVTSIVKDDYESYIMMLKRLWLVINKNKELSMLISKQELAKGWNGEVYPKILNELD